MFLLALPVAVIHALPNLPEESHEPATFAALAMPAAAAAIGGWLAQRDYRRHTNRYKGWSACSVTTELP